MATIDVNAPTYTTDLDGTSIIYMIGSNNQTLISQGKDTIYLQTNPVYVNSNNNASINGDNSDLTEGGNGIVNIYGQYSGLYVTPGDNSYINTTLNGTGNIDLSETSNTQVSINGDDAGITISSVNYNSLTLTGTFSSLNLGNEGYNTNLWISLENNGTSTIDTMSNANNNITLKSGTLDFIDKNTSNNTIYGEGGNLNFQQDNLFNDSKNTITGTFNNLLLSGTNKETDNNVNVTASNATLSSMNNNNSAISVTGDGTGDLIANSYMTRTSGNGTLDIVGSWEHINATLGINENMNVMTGGDSNTNSQIETTSGSVASIWNPTGRYVEVDNSGGTDTVTFGSGYTNVIDFMMNDTHLTIKNFVNNNGNYNGQIMLSYLSDEANIVETSSSQGTIFTNTINGSTVTIDGISPDKLGLVNPPPNSGAGAILTLSSQ